MIIKCKMCGGDIDFIPGATYGTCEYCGSTSTIPQAEDENKLNRYNRANHFRRQCEFDKAVAAYEKILEQDDTDAEAHWGAVISRFGIEYVEDPATHQRIPTCHRVQVASILTDEDYLAAVENAPDEESRRIYQEEAARIAEIQKGILAISANEKPYDVFICYKETDENGQRTRDSQWAQDVYYGLTEQGLKVFFSRITLEDKLGQQYEPYIFAALNSAKVMVVIGSRPEYFNAVWVKNEWSRYLSLMKHDHKRLLIPCYRGMDPYDLPEELSMLQSQDMSKIGFMQDLLRGIQKVMNAGNQAEASGAVRQVVQTAAGGMTPGINSLMERTYLFMEDGDFDSAGEYINRVLDIDPKYAPAYAAKVCVDFRIRKESGLADAPFLYEDNSDWQKALRFADSNQRAIYAGYIEKVKPRVAAQIRDYAFDCAVELAVNPKANREQLERELASYKTSCQHSNGRRATGSRRRDSQQNASIFQKAVSSGEPGDVSEKQLKTAAEMFVAIGDSEGSACAQKCLALAGKARQKQIYVEALNAYQKNKNSVSDLEQTAKVFLTITEYKDSKEQAKKCIDTAEAIRAGLYVNAVGAMKDAEANSGKWSIVMKELAKPELNDYRDVPQLRKQAEQCFDECLAAEKELKRQKEESARRAAEAAAAKKKRKIVFSIMATAMLVAIVLLITQVIIPQNNYRSAEALRADGRYEEAIAAFMRLGDYSDAKMQIAEMKYQRAVILEENGQYEEAIAAFTELGDYSDAKMQVEKMKRQKYQQAVALRENGRYEEAIVTFAELDNYSDAKTQITETKYQQANSLNAAARYNEAYTIYVTLTGYKDVDKLLAEDDNMIAAAAAAARDAKFAVGNYVTFGTYPQTKAGNDKTPIEWLVLARDGNKALLISRYALDAKPYNTSYYTNVTWETCTLRTWLNGTFYNKAFSSAEQAAILTTSVDNSKNQGYSKWSTSGGNNTQDKVFLLSYAEANKYFAVTYDNSKNTKSRVAPTAYALAQGAFTTSSNKTADGTAAGWWWLRSPGGSQRGAAHVSIHGSLFDDYLANRDGSVRPALWVNIESPSF